MSPSSLLHIDQALKKTKVREVLLKKKKERKISKKAQIATTRHSKKILIPVFISAKFLLSWPKVKKNKNPFFFFLPILQKSSQIYGLHIHMLHFSTQASSLPKTFNFPKPSPKFSPLPNSHFPMSAH